MSAPLQILPQRGRGTVRRVVEGQAQNPCCRLTRAKRPSAPPPPSLVPFPVSGRILRAQRTSRLRAFAPLREPKLFFCLTRSREGAKVIR